MLYVDGLVAALPEENRTTYQRLIDDVTPLIRQYGAIKVVHCNDRQGGTNSDVETPNGNDSAVVFSWIVWPSREARDQGMEQMLSDPRLDSVMNPAALDGERVELDASLMPRLH